MYPNLGSRVPDILPYIVLALGVLLYASPFMPLGEIELGVLIPVAPSYVAAGGFAWLYTRGKVERSSYVLSVPAATFLALGGMWFYFESPSPYEMSPDPYWVLSYGIISLFFVLGYTTKKKEWGYVAASVLAYFVCAFAVLPLSSLRFRLDHWASNPFSLFMFVLTLGPGIPIAVVAYFVLGGNPNKRERAYLAVSLLAYVVWVEVLTSPVGMTLRSLASILAIVLGLGIPLAVVAYFPSDGDSDKRRRTYVSASLLAYVVWIVVLPGSVVLNLRSLIFALPIVLGLGIPQVVVPYLLSDDNSKKREWTYLGASLLAYVVWVFASTVVVRPLFASFEGYFLLALTLGAGTPLAVVAYVVSGRNQSGRSEEGKQT